MSKFFYKIAFKVWDKLNRVFLSIKGVDFSPNYSHRTDEAAHCTSVPVGQTREIISRITDRQNFLFYDIGAGKGYVAYHAAKYFKFKRVIGIELVPELSAIASINISKLDFRLSGQVSIFNANALEYEYADQDSVFYFFNPFPSQVFLCWVQYALSCVEKSRIVIILCHPVSGSYSSILIDNGFLLSYEIDHGFSRSLMFEYKSPRTLNTF